MSGTEFVIDVDTLQTVEQLALVSARLVDGMLTGCQHNVRLGLGGEFASYRPYVQGDDMRHIDWKLWGRTDQYYVRQFELETNMPVYLFLDTSASMGFGRNTSKFDYARLLTACLAQVCSEQHDAPGLVLFGRECSLVVTPKAGAFQLPRICEALVEARCSGVDGPQKTLVEALSAFHRRGMVIVVSDFLWPTGDLDEFLGRSQGFGHDTVLFQINSREEVSFPYRGNLRFHDLETDEEIDVSCAEVKESYLGRVQGYFDAVAGVCSEHNADLLRLVTDEDMGERIAGYLDSRILEVRR